MTLFHDQVIKRSSCVCMRCGWTGTTHTLEPCVPLSDVGTEARGTRRDQGRDSKIKTQAGKRRNAARLARRLHHQHTTEPIDIAAKVDCTGAAKRGEQNAFVNAAAEYEINPHVSIFGRIDNLTDEEYAEVFRFPALGCAIYGGVKVRF